MSGMWDPWTADQQRLADEFDRYTGVAPSARGGRNLADEEDDDGLSDAERGLAEHLDRATKLVADDEDAADSRSRDYTGLGDRDAVTLALTLDSLTGVRP